MGQSEAGESAAQLRSGQANAAEGDANGIGEIGGDIEQDQAAKGLMDAAQDVAKGVELLADEEMIEGSSDE